MVHNPSGMRSPETITDGAPALKAELSRRHLTMISIGGVIGGGLFLGSGEVIGKVGPAAVLTYFAAGLLVVLIIRMLGEMASARPTLGSFSEYAHSSMGHLAGFSTGWLYAYQWLTAIALEAILSASIVREWWPQLPLWAASLLILALMTATNLYSARSFGEVETWLSAIKVIAIVLFILIGLGVLVGIGSKSPFDTHILTGHGGLLPKGTTILFATIPIVIVAFFGSEVATIAAAESSEPRANIARATNSVIIRIMTFYVLSLLLIVFLIPWESADVGSPFANALKTIGIPGADLVMNIVIVSAVVSCLNSGIYASSRMVYSLAHRGDAPAFLLRTSKRGVPIPAVLLVTSGGFIAAILAAIFPKQITFFLLNSAGAIAILVYLAIAISHLVMRRKLDRDANKEVDAQRIRMWLYPFLDIIAITAMVAVLVSMWFIRETKLQLVLTMGSVLVVILFYVLVHWRKSKTWIAAKTPQPLRKLKRRLFKVQRAQT